MSYTILSARYANADHSAAIITTQEAGAVAIGQSDTPALWAQMLQDDVVAYVPPDFRPAVIAEFKAERELLVNRMVTLAFAMKEDGQDAFAAALLWMRKQIIPLDSHPYVVQETAKGYEEARASYKVVYGQLVQEALTPIPDGGQFAPDLTTALAWKVEIDKVFK